MKIDMLKYGAIADGVFNNTKIVQKAIDECYVNGGGEIVFPAGEYVLATVFLKSGVHIRIDESAKLLGTLDFLEYEKDEKVDYPLYQDASHSFFHCSMLVGIDLENVKIYGGGMIDMRSVWDENNIRNMVRRGAKAIALKRCNNVVIDNIGVYRATDLAIYFAGCENVEISRIKMRTHIDGISPDNCKNVKIHDCQVYSGDDGIVFKSSYTLNQLGICENIEVYNCEVQSTCNAIKFGTETNGGFENIRIHDCKVTYCSLAGLVVESVDGAVIKNVTFENIQMTNVVAPFFICVGKRMRGPQGLEIGSISDVTFKNISATGEYKPCNVTGARTAYPWGEATETPPITPWQITSVVHGLEESPVKNLRFENVYLKTFGACEDAPAEMGTSERAYPEIFNWGRLLPSKGICFKNVDGLILENVKVETYYDDVREAFKFYNVKNLLKI